MTVLEIAVQDAVGARVARQAGAARVELCVALGATGGLTPSAGLIEAAAAEGIAVHALIRCRAGGFVYSKGEIDTMVRDIRAALAAGASGVVLGALTVAGTVDRAAVERLVAAADGAEVTFHRAMDVAADRLATLDLLVDLGIARVLTSGGAARCGAGLDALAAMARHSAGRIQIQAGGGVGIDDIPALVRAGVDAIHLSAKALADDPADAGPGGGSGGYEVTDPGLVAAAVAALKAC